MGIFAEGDLEKWEIHLVDMASVPDCSITYEYLKKIPVDEVIMIMDRQNEIARIREAEAKKKR